MKATYGYDHRRQYLILEEESAYCEDYRFRMLLSNHLPGLLPCNVRGIDDRSRFYYDVTGKMTLLEKAEGKGLYPEDVRRLLYALAGLEEVCSGYLLTLENVILEPEYIFADEEQYWFCFLPLWNREPAEALKGMIPFFRDHMRGGAREVRELLKRLERDAGGGLQSSREKEALYDFGTACDFADAYEPEEDYWGQDGAGKPAARRAASAGGNERVSIWKRVFSCFRRNREADDDLEEDPATTLLYDPDSPQMLSLLSEDGCEQMSVHATPFLIGSLENAAQGVILNPAVSRRHASIERLAGNFYLQDLHSTNGTYHNGRRLSPGERAELADRDVVAFANACYRVYLS